MNLKPIFYISLLTIFSNIYSSNIYASVLGDCADAGGSVCTDDNVRAVGAHKDIDPDDPEFDDVVAAECKTACINKAASLETFMSIHTNGGNWVCTATSSNFEGLSTTHTGTKVLCSCSVTCVEGLRLNEADYLLAPDDEAVGTLP